MTENENIHPVPKTKDAVAVALSDKDSGPGHAPKVVAGGRGRIAEQILQIAFAQGIKVREDADLAELLTTIDEDEEIPVEAFAAVAEIMIYLYRFNGGGEFEGKSREDLVREWMGKPAPGDGPAENADGADDESAPR